MQHNQVSLSLPSELRKKCKGFLVDYEALDDLCLPRLQPRLSVRLSSLRSPGPLSHTEIISNF